MNSRINRRLVGSIF